MPLNFPAHGEKVKKRKKERSSARNYRMFSEEQGETGRNEGKHSSPQRKQKKENLAWGMAQKKKKRKLRKKRRIQRPLQKLGISTHERSVLRRGVHDQEKKQMA